MAPEPHDRGALNCHADQDTDAVDYYVCGFDRVAVGEDFGDFMNRAYGGNEGHNVRCRPKRTAEAKGGPAAGKLPMVKGPSVSSVAATRAGLVIRDRLVVLMGVLTLSRIGTSCQRSCRLNRFA